MPLRGRKRAKYKDLDFDFHFEPVLMETLGEIGESSMSFLTKLGEKIVTATGDDNASLFLRQRLVIAIQMGNCACLTETLSSPDSSFLQLDF